MPGGGVVACQSHVLGIAGSCFQDCPLKMARKHVLVYWQLGN
jgi:hypothetical protein